MYPVEEEVLFHDYMMFFSLLSVMVYWKQYKDKKTMKLSSSRLDMETARLERPVVKNYHETVAGGSAGTNTTSDYTVDVSSGNIHNLILAVAATTFSFTNPPAWGTNGRLTLILKQDATGGRTVIWPAEVQWPSGSAPTLTTTPKGIDVITFTTFDNGSTWFGSIALINSKRLRTLWTVGRADLGQLGNQQSASPRSSPLQIGSLTDWAMVSGGKIHSCAVKTDGTLWSWGAGTNEAGAVGLGQIGDGTTVNKSSPVQVGSLTAWANVAGGIYHTLATKTDGTLWSFGKNSFGQLGDSTTVSKSSPIQVGSLTTWATFSAKYHTLATKTDGTLWSFGISNYGQLGDGTTVNKSSPVQIGALTTWASVASGLYHSLALKTDGTLWTFGRNSLGQLGDGTTVNKSSPVQVGALTTWASIASGNFHSIALKTDGTLWTFGRSNYGQLGDGTTVNKSSPVQVGALTTWASISSGSFHTLALKTDSTRWAFGRNSLGQVGDSSSADKSSPVQVGSLSDWASVASGAYHSMCLRKN